MDDLFGSLVSYNPNDNSSDDGNLCLGNCNEYYSDLVNNLCKRCNRNLCTVLEMNTSFPEVILTLVFLFLGVKINHRLRKIESKSLKVCWRFRKTGRCRFGDSCFFVHVQKIPQFGKKYQFIHKSQTICRLFQNGQHCQFGSRCHYVHTFQKICRYHLIGKCRFGKKCRNYHLTAHI